MNPSRITIAPLIAVALVALGLMAGCGGSGGGDAPERISLSGKVTFNGQPVPAGDLSFAPDREQGNKGPAGVATIEDGVYHTVDGKGPVAGAQVVTINGFEAGESADPASGPPVLFSDYQTKVVISPDQSELDFEVKLEGAP